MVDGAALPAGVRFYPTEQELVGFYLRNKLEHKRPDMERFIPVVDVYSYEPMELPLMSGEASVGDPEQWFFFCPRQAREAQGGRPTRTTRSGFWKATGSATPVFHNHRVIGIRKTMVFYHGRAPTARKTPWKMNEYRAAATVLQHEEAAAAGEEQAAATSSTAAPPYNSSPAPATNSGADLIKWRSEFSLCRVYKKSGHLRSFDRRPIVRVERDQNPAGVDDDGGVHVVPSSTSRPPPADHDINNNAAAASAMADDGNQMNMIYRSGSSSDGRPQEHDDVLANIMELDGGADGDCDDLEGLDWDSLIGFDGI